MIPYPELDRALARWKARAQSAGGDAAHQGGVDDAATVVRDMSPSDDYGNVPQAIDAEGGVPGLPPPRDSTGEIDLGDAVVESYDDDDNNR